MNKGKFFWAPVVIGFLSLFLQFCAKPTTIEETEFKFLPPSEFGEEVDSIEVYVEYQGKVIELFKGSRSTPGFEGPWTETVTDYEGGEVVLRIVTFDSEGESLGEGNYTLDAGSNSLVPDVHLSFYFDSLAVNLTDELIALSFTVSPPELAYTLSTSDSSIISLEGTNAMIHDTGLVYIVLGVEGSDVRDTMVVTITLSSSEFVFEFDVDSLSLNYGLTDFPLPWTITPTGFTGTISCISIDSAIVTVTSDGKATPIRTGSGKIICGHSDLSSRDSLIIVVPEIDETEVLDSIRLEFDTLTHYLGDTPQSLSYDFYPDTLSPTILWSSSDGSIASVSNEGEVTAYKEGNVWISVIGAAASVVKDSLYLQVIDSTQGEAARWTADTLILNLSEGDSGTINLSDSIINPALSPLSFELLTQNEITELQDGKFKYSTWAEDSGTYFDKIILTGGSTVDTAVIRLTISASYYTLTLEATNGSITPDKTEGPFRLGTIVTLTPTPENGYGFSGWAGDNDGQTVPLPVLMDSDKTISANFALTSILECKNIATGGSLNSEIKAVYASPQKKGTLCPEAGGKFDSNTIGVNGKVKILIR